MMVSPGGRPYSATPLPSRAALHFMVSRVLFAEPKSFADQSARYGVGPSLPTRKNLPMFLPVESFAARRHDKVETLHLAGLVRARRRARLQHLQAQPQPSADDGGSRDRHGRRG